MRQTSATHPTGVPQPETRISARLDEEDARRLAYLRERTGSNVSELVKRGLRLLYESTSGEVADARAVLEATGFIGCAEGPGDLSRRYKQELADSLAAKHGDR